MIWKTIEDGQEVWHKTDFPFTDDEKRERGLAPDSKKKGFELLRDIPAGWYRICGKAVNVSIDQGTGFGDPHWHYHIPFNNQMRLPYHTGGNWYCKDNFGGLFGVPVKRLTARDLEPIKDPNIYDIFIAMQDGAVFFINGVICYATYNDSAEEWGGGTCISVANDRSYTAEFRNGEISTPESLSDGIGKNIYRVTLDDIKIINEPNKFDDSLRCGYGFGYRYRSKY